MELETKGVVIGPIDLLIAGTAISRGAVLVTSNTREFSRVKGLRLSDWTRISRGPIIKPPLVGEAIQEGDPSPSKGTRTRTLIQFNFRRPTRLTTIEWIRYSMS